MQPVAPDPTSDGHWILDEAPSCNATQPVTPVGPDQVQVELGTAMAPVLTCDFVYQLVAPSTLNLVKVIEGDTAAQQGPVAVTASCDDGASATLLAAPGQATPWGLPAALTIPFPAVCQISETATGAAPGASVTTTTAITTNGTAVQGSLAALAVGSDSASVATAVTFTDTYTAAQGSGSGPQLAAFGFTSADQDLALQGMLFLLVGVALVFAVRPRVRRS